LKAERAASSGCGRNFALITSGGINSLNTTGWPVRYEGPSSSRPEGGLNLKKQAVKTFVLLGILLSLSAIYVYAREATMIRKVEIPFDFSVGNKTYPAGTYRITRVTPDKTVIQLNSEDGKQVVRVLTFPVRAKEIPETGKLNFRRYGKSYFLYQIWEPTDYQGRQLSKSRTERSVERDFLTKRGEEPAIVDLVVATP